MTDPNTFFSHWFDDDEYFKASDFYTILRERDEYALLLFQPQGESHHNANECPYCRENLNK